MSFSTARMNASFGSRSRRVAGRSRSARPARRPSSSTHAISLKRGLELFRREVWKYWKEHGRHDLPWRETTDSYKILVSEVMLQQTQVGRAIPFYRNFLKRFPTIHALAQAPFLDVLKVWSGLGYNRRAKYLHDAARTIVEKYRGRVPAMYSELVELPGVGDYTAKAVRVFAFNELEIIIETNIRSALIHHFFPVSQPTITLRGRIELSYVHDADVREIAEQLAKGQDPREWHWALMDYGAQLKKNGLRNNHRSKHYVRQSKFEGSLRQIRGAVLSAMVHKKSMRDLQTHYAERWEQTLKSLMRDGLIPDKHSS